MARSNDKYANIAAATLQQSAANTLTFGEVLTGISLGQGRGMLIDQVDYWVQRDTRQLMTAADDAVHFGWCSSTNVTSLDDYEDRSIIHAGQVIRNDFGVAASAQMSTDPQVFQFFPPIILAAPRIYFAVNSIGLAAVGTVKSRVYFRYIDLSSQEYLEIAETFTLVG